MKIEHFGEAFKRTRTASKKSQRAVAEMLAIDNGNISRVENGKQGLVFDKLLKLDDVLGKPLSDIFKLAETISSGGTPPLPPDPLDRLLGELRAAASNGLTEAETTALADALRAQLAWIRARGPATPATDITPKDTESYFAILYQGKTNRWLLRYFADRKQPGIQVCIQMTDERRHEISRAGLEVQANDSIGLASPDHLARIPGILADCLDYCRDDSHFKKGTHAGP